MQGSATVGRKETPFACIGGKIFLTDPGYDPLITRLLPVYCRLIAR